MAIQWIHLRYMTIRGGKCLVVVHMNTLPPDTEMFLFAPVKDY